jgi:twitching motility protein PilU
MVAGKKDGMQTFDEHLFELYTSGAITQQTAVAFADSASEVRLRLRGLSG